MTDNLRSVNFFNFLISILAGICISFGGLAFLSAGSPLGAILFSFGLCCVIVFKMKLFTGMAGIVKFTGKDFLNLFIALIGNIIGCFIIGNLIAKSSLLPVQDAAQSIIEARISAGFIKCFLLSIGCGFIVDVSVRSAKENKWVVLLLGIPTFILCGFPHCIADAFYMSAAPINFMKDNLQTILINYAAIVLGNSVGCNFYRIFTLVNPSDK